MKTLNIIEQAHRGTLEEQDDTIIWLTHTLKGAGADVDVLLRGSAVCYTVHNQDASGLSFGGRKQAHPPQLDEDLRALMGKGVNIYAVADDLAMRGIEPQEILAGVQTIGKGELPGMMDKYERIWQW